LEIHIYQIFGIIIGIIAIIWSILRFRESKMSLGMLTLWIFNWIMIIGISIDPKLTNLFASVTGIGRGLDFILIIGLIGCYYLLFKMYTLIENMEKEITELVREIALQKDEINSKNDKNYSDKK
jgi:hypothetical protein